MLEIAKNQLFKRLQQTAGVEIIIEANDELKIYYVILKNKLNQISIQSKATTSEGIKSIAKSIPAFCPVYISIEGKGVLHKKVQFTSESDSNIKQLAEQSFPGIDVDNFHIQVYKTSEDYAFISVIRKDLLDKLINECKANHLFPQKVIIGSFSIGTVTYIMDVEGVSCNNYKIDFKNNNPCNIVLAEDSDAQSYNYIDTEKIEKTFTVSYANALTRLLPIDINTSFDPTESTLRSEFIFKILTGITWKSIIGIILLISLINYFVYSKIKSDNIEFGLQYKTNESYVEEIQNIKEIINIKEKFIQDNKLYNTTRISYYLDRLVINKPTGLHFDEVRVFPLPKKNREQLKLESLSHDNIRVLGQCTSTVLKDYLKHLHKEDWVKDIQLDEFIYNTKSKKGEFNIIISIKN